MALLDLDAVIAATGELRPLPATTARLTHLLSDEDVDLRDVARVVALDAPLTARLLRTANSALYGGRIAVASVEDAVTRLGSGVVLSLTISATLKKELVRGVPQYDLAEGELWRRSVAAALAAESLKASLSRVSVPPVAYTAALLHEIGKLVLARFLDDDALSMLARAKSEPDFNEAAFERRLFGVHHAEVGALVAQRWKLPRVIVHAIEYCHDPDNGCDRLHGYEDGADEPLFDVTCDSVHVADAISQALVGGADETFGRLSTTARIRLGCDDNALQRAVERSKKRLAEVLALYN